jgi:serine/threonine-protein kinase RsbW
VRLASNAMTASVDLRLSGSLDHLRLVWQTGETLLEAFPFDEDPEGTRYNVLVALQEIVTNVLRYAYQGDEARPLQVQFRADDQEFRIVVRDGGPAFDPLQHKSLVDTATPNEAGGYGIMIMRAVMDDVSYRRDGAWNVLTMVKRARRAAAVATRNQG